MPKPHWSEPFTEEIERNLFESAKCCYENGRELILDLGSLHSAGRLSRAMALAIYAQEEFLKALMLLVFKDRMEWNSDVHATLTQHKSKHALHALLADYAAWFQEENKFALSLNRVALVSVPTQAIPSPEVQAELLANHKEHKSANKKDLKRQRLIYTTIDTKGRASPAERVSEAELQAEIKIAVELREAVAYALRYPKFSQIRTET